MILNLILVGIGGFFGAISRLLISEFLNKSSKPIPLGTLTANLSGSFLIGLITGLNSNEMIALLFGAGFLGSYTTFSTFKLEMIQIHFKKYQKVFITYLIMTYGLGIILAYLGYMIGLFFFN